MRTTGQLGELSLPAFGIPFAPTPARDVSQGVPLGGTKMNLVRAGTPSPQASGRVQPRRTRTFRTDGGATGEQPGSSESCPCPPLAYHSPYVGKGRFSRRPSGWNQDELGQGRDASPQASGRVQPRRTRTFRTDGGATCEQPDSSESCPCPPLAYHSPLRRQGTFLKASLWVEPR